jgi:hypothetical protein
MRRLVGLARGCRAPLALALALVLALAPAAGRAAPASSRATLALPAHPASGLAERLRHHQAEAALRRAPLPAPAGGAGLGLAGFAALAETGWRLGHQEAEVSVDPQAPGLAVALTCTVEALDAEVKSVTLLLPLAAAVEAVALADGATVSWSAGTLFGQLRAVEVTLAPPLAAGASRQLALRYQATLDCDAKTSLLRTCTFNDEFWQVLFFRVFADHGAAHHAPHTSTLHVRTPPGRMAAAPGTPLGVTAAGPGWLRWSFEQSERTENGGFAIADFRVTGGGPEASGAPWLRLLTLPSFTANAPALLSSAAAMIDFFGEAFGAFPWSGLSLIQVANNFGGGYAPLGGIFMLRNVFGAQPQGQGWTGWSELAAHEIAHQWWGNLARPLSGADVSLSESLAEFSSCRYTEETLQTRRQLIEDNLSYVYTVSAQDDRPLGSAAVYSSPAYVPIVYHKGAVVFDMLRLELGDAALLAGLRAYAAAYDRDYARVADLRAALELATGADLGWFFAQWFVGKGRIDVELAAAVLPAAGGGYLLRLRLAQLGAAPLRFKLPLRLTLADGTVRDEVVQVEPPEQGWVSLVELTLPARPLLVRPDPERRLLRRFNVLDGADVSLDGEVDGVDLVESAFRQGRRVVWQGNFFPNTLWDETFDGDASFVIDAGDLDLIYQRAGEASAVF